MGVVYSATVGGKPATGVSRVDEHRVRLSIPTGVAPGKADVTVFAGTRVVAAQKAAVDVLAAAPGKPSLAVEPVTANIEAGKPVRLVAKRTDADGHVEAVRPDWWAFYTARGSAECLYATCDGNGLVTAHGLVAPDPLLVYAHVEKGSLDAHAALSITGGKVPESITLPATTRVQQGVNGEVSFAAHYTDGTKTEHLYHDTNDVTWHSADESKVTVDNRGNLQGVEATATPVDVTVTIAARGQRSELSATTKVTVTRDPMGQQVVAR